MEFDKELNEMIECNASGQKLCTLREALVKIDEYGFDNPIEIGYSPQELTWLNPDYVRSTDDPDWPEDCPYWYA